MHTPTPPPAARRVAALGIALVVGLFYYATHAGAGDLGWALRSARDLWAGRDPYAYPFNSGSIPYPLPAALVVMPIAWLPDQLAGALFVAVSAGLLAYAMSRESWRGLLVFLSAPYFYALSWAQWSPLIAASAGWPVLAGLVYAAKPQIAAAVVLSRLNWDVIAVGGGVIGLSWLLMPDWPLRWVGQISEYRRFVPILTPVGPLLALACALHIPSWRDPRSQTLFLALLFSARAAYDTVILWTSLRPTRWAALATLATWSVALIPAVDEGTRVALAIYLPIIFASAPWQYWRTRFLAMNESSQE